MRLDVATLVRAFERASAGGRNISDGVLAVVEEVDRLRALDLGTRRFEAVCEQAFARAARELRTPSGNPVTRAELESDSRVRWLAAHRRTVAGWMVDAGLGYPEVGRALNVSKAAAWKMVNGSGQIGERAIKAVANG